ncbi:MAG: HlyC/CorC family transporter [Acidobacteria bacterium]|nr:HlyC/CorC family transporter [Acidobacteriota bacterium]
MTTIIDLAVLPFLVVLAGFFAVAETSLFSLRPWRLDRIVREHPQAGETIVRLLAEPMRLLVTLVVGAELSSIAFGNLIAMIRRDSFGDMGEIGVILAVALTSSILLLGGEIIPKALAASYPERTALTIAAPLAAVARALSPLSMPLAVLASRMPAASRSMEDEPLSEGDFRVMIEMGMKEGVLDAREIEMIGAVFRLGDTPVRAVMVPRTDISALPASASIAEALSHVRKARHSRVPIYERDLDHIVGVLYAKDLLAAMDPAASADSIRALLRPPFFVPESMRGRHLVREFQARRLHLAVVVDEYGGTQGIVSLEDLLEEIVGDFADDFDRPLIEHRRMRRGVDWARGSMPFTEFKRKLRARARGGPYDTLGGYVLKLLGRVPVDGDRVSDGQFVFTVLRMRSRRILELAIERSEPGEKKGPESPPGPDTA